MSRIFLSHSRRDNRAAVALKRWLGEQRPELANEIFLDIDPVSGMQPGARWKGQLFKSNSRCEAVICLLSTKLGSFARVQDRIPHRRRAWASRSCARGWRTLGDTDITSRVAALRSVRRAAPRRRSQCHGGPPVRFNTAALYRLRKAIEGTGVGPENFVWPPAEDPQRAPYRGWEPFEDIDAGVFFGRDAAIVRGLDELRAMRLLGARKSLFVVLGPRAAASRRFCGPG